ncbi:MAG: hypothetical protein U9Q34_07610, partial [Elusimicrobiota bacterium]|nr:hypothetical protein [Elusimicrobiota bacterium]
AYETEYQMFKSDEDGIEHPKNIKLAKGDIISFTRNDYEKYDIRNGEKAEILECGRKNIKVKTEDERILDINTNEYKSIDYGYALTTYKSQGQTYDKVVIESDTAVPVLSDMRNQYVNITRARDSVKIFTDDIEDLKELAEVKIYARETIEMTRDEPIIRKEKTIEINNPFLMEQVKGLDDLTKKYTNTQKEITKTMYSINLEEKEKEDIGKILNGKSGAKLIAKYGESPDIVIYAGLCMVKEDIDMLDEYSIDKDIKLKVSKIVKNSKKLNTGFDR